MVSKFWATMPPISPLEVMISMLLLPVTWQFSMVPWFWIATVPVSPDTDEGEESVILIFTFSTTALSAMVLNRAFPFHDRLMV